MEEVVRVLDGTGLDDLITALAADHRVYGPTVRDRTIRYGSVASIGDLPRGWRDDQAAGAYSLVEDPGSDLRFSYAVGPDSLKQHFHPPTETLFTAERHDGEIVFAEARPSQSPAAFVGVRACELAAVDVQDAVLRRGPHRDEAYAARREDVFIVAVDCGFPADTCFCTSMGTGPGATSGFDIAVTEVPSEAGVRYVCRAGTRRGAELLDTVGATEANAGLRAAAKRIIDSAAAAMPHRLDPETARDVLAAHPEAAVWTDIESRCLACTNCTMVCPTCFCTTVVDSTDLSTDEWVRSQVWDSCFSLDFSALHGQPVRASIGARYRQWLTHKLSTWWDQFGSSGCVGCGRCITWCPVGIDLVEEVQRLEAEVGV